MESNNYPGSYYQPLFDLLNQEHGITPLESEMTDIIFVVEKMRGKQEGPRWVKGDYERLYDQLKANPEKKVACFVDYYWDRDKTREPLRDICAVRGDTLEFNARGIGYGGAPSWFDERDKKEAFLDECVRLNVEWLDEQPAAGREEELKAEIERRTKLLEDDLKRDCRLNMPGISEQEQEATWQAYKKRHNL